MKLLKYRLFFLIASVALATGLVGYTTRDIFDTILVDVFVLIVSTSCLYEI